MLEDCLEDASVAEVAHIDRSVQARDGGDVHGGPIGAVNGHVHILVWMQRAFEMDVEGLGAGQSERLRTFTTLELQWEDPHADKVGPVDAFVTLGDDGLDTEQEDALRGPVTRRTLAVILAGDDHERRTRGLVPG